MFVFGNLIGAVASVLDFLITVAYFILLARVVISWVNADPYNPIVKFLYAVTEPVLRPFRRLVPPWRTGGLDISPIIVFLILFFIRMFAVTSLHQLAYRLQ